MATYRTVYLSFWTDTKVEDEFTPEDKYFFLYLLTNPHTNLCGCYECSVGQMARDTGYNENTIKRLLARMEKVLHVILYDEQTKEVLILNWGKYNWCNSPKTKAGAEKVAAHIKSDFFRGMVLKAISDTLSIPYPYPMDTSVTVLYIEDSKDDSITNKATNKKIVAESFDTFWKAYPNKKSKGTARKAFDKALKKTTFDTIMNALEQAKQSRQWLKDGGDFIPYPATWLNAEGWEDEVSKATDRSRSRNTLLNYKEEGVSHAELGDIEMDMEEL